MSYQQFKNLFGALLVVFSTALSSARSDEPDSSTDGSPLVLVFDSTMELPPDSVPLEPRDYFPLGRGIRKNSKTSLVPFCVAIHPLKKSCTYAQYFEIEPATYRDSERVMDVEYGIPSDRVGAVDLTFRGQKIGAPFTGYRFTDEAFRAAVDAYLRSFAAPAYDSSVGFLGSDDLEGKTGNLVCATLGAGAVGLFWFGPAVGEISGDWDTTYWKTVLITAATPAAVFAGVWFGKHLIAHFKKRGHRKMLVRTQARVSDAFLKSKRLGENWTLIRGVKVPAKTYDQFVEFLRQRGDESGRLGMGLQK